MAFGAFLTGGDGRPGLDSAEVFGEKVLGRRGAGDTVGADDGALAWAEAELERGVLSAVMGHMSASMPLLASSSMASTAEAFPSRSDTPIWRR